jgi:hypothetical protein
VATTKGAGPALPEQAAERARVATMKQAREKAGSQVRDKAMKQARDGAKQAKKEAKQKREARREQRAGAGEGQCQFRDASGDGSAQPDGQRGR